jgi:DNA-binding LacI/PurR family transcriptional regulator
LTLFAIYYIVLLKLEARWKNLVTLKDIAKLSGLSLSTVSVVLNGKAETFRIPHETRQRVLDAAKTLEYRPNIAARRLRRDPREQPLIVAIFWTSDFRAPMLMRFLKGIQTKVAELDRKVEIIIHTYKNDELDQAVNQQVLAMFNAAIICNISPKDQQFLEMNQFNLPIILFNRLSEAYCTVNIDDSKLGSVAAQVFASHKHSSTGVITADPVFKGMDVRTKSFMDTAKALNLKISAVLNNDNSLSGGYMAAQQLLLQHELPGCLFCASDAIAAGVLRGFYKAQIRVPEDIEIISVGNGDADLEENLYVSLSVVHVPIEKMAEASLELLIEVIDNHVAPPYSIYLPVEYKARESCGVLRE